MFYNLRERSALGIRNTGKNVIEALSDVPFEVSQVGEKLFDLAKRPGEYLFFGYGVGDRVSVTMYDKEVWYRIESRYIDVNTGELTYDAILVSDRSWLRGLAIRTRISIHHKDVYRKG